jgi:hypothetical protein
MSWRRALRIPFVESARDVSYASTNLLCELGGARTLAGARAPHVCARMIMVEIGHWLVDYPGKYTVVLF